MAKRPRKSSACVTLVLIGAAALAGCGSSNDAARRKQYATKAECVADWGDPKDCEEQVSKDTSGNRRSYYSYSGSGSHGGGWWGSSGSHGSGSSSSSASRSVSRGGFGSSGHSSSS